MLGLKYFTGVPPEGNGFEHVVQSLYQRVWLSDFFAKIRETFAVRLLLVLMGIITSVLVARLLGPEGRGVYAVAMTIGAVGVQFGNLGLHASNTYCVSRHRELLPGLLSNTLVVGFGIGGLLAVLMWVVSSFWPGIAPLHGALLLLSLAWIPFGLSYMLTQNLLLGIDEVRAYNVIELVSRIIGLSLIGILLLCEMITVELLFATGFLGLLTGFIWSLWRLKSHLGRVPLPSITLFKTHISYGLKAYAGAIFAFLVLRVDLLIVQYVLGAEEAGYYSVAVIMADMTYLLPTVIATLLFPRLAGMPLIADKWNVTKRVALMVGFVMMVFGGAAALLSEPVVRVVFGETFLPSARAFVWLLPGIVMLSINTMFMTYFASIGMPLIVVYSPAVATVLNITLNLKLLAWFGIIGAAMASTVSYGAMLIGSVLYVLWLRR